MAAKKQIALRLTPETIEAVDKARGKTPRQQWLESVVREAVERDASGGLNRSPQRPARPAEPRRWEDSESIWKDKPLLAERLKRFGR